MINDALAGKIDLIVTKSVSRFARNTVDSLVTIRKLKANGIECYFEKEQIYTFDSKGELLLTIMSSLAQEESRSISENTTWGRRKQFSDGKFSVAYSTFLGYEKGEDGGLKVVESEAKVVRLIYKLFLMGKTPHRIATTLEGLEIKSPSGKDKWSTTNPYVWGGSSPSTSFDCSGFVCWVFKNSGVYPLERATAQGICNQCSIIPRSDAKPGDIIFFKGTYNTSEVSHVGIYVGDGMMIHCGDVRPDRAKVEVDERRTESIRLKT